MNEMNILFSMEKPEDKQKEIVISIENQLEDDLDYKFLVGLEGSWTTLTELSAASSTLWKPETDAKYSIMVQAKRKESKKAFDFVSKTEYIVGDFEEKLISDIYIDKSEIVVGEKITLTVEAKKIPIMYRYWIGNQGNWLLIKDYSSENIMTWASKYSGQQEFLVECKNLDSENVFDDSMKIQFNVKPLQSLEIMKFKCLSKEMISGKELVFDVQASHDDNRMILYKFVKIDPCGNSVCIQDYSTKKLVSYVEESMGKFKLLCMAKDMYSPCEFDDRALIHYSVKPYHEINIQSFTSNLSSPQLCDTRIILSCIVSGGKDLLYRFKITGKHIEDSGYIGKNNYTWAPSEAGKYEVCLWVKDSSFKSEYEKNVCLDFTIDKIADVNVIIEDIVLDKKNTILVGELVHVEVKATGGNSLRYSFSIFENDSEIEKIEYGVHDFVDYTPEKSGKYKLEVRVKDKYSKREFDCLQVLYIEALAYIPAQIDYVLMPTRDYYMVGDTIKLEVICENTRDTLVNYVLTINGHSVEETNFVEHKNYELKPRCSGTYLIELRAKNRSSTELYDCMKQIKIQVQDTLPITDTRILCDKTNFRVNEAITFVTKNLGGRDVVYEFYLMEKGEWSLVQRFSKKNDYTFMPFTKGIYRVIVLSKNFYNSISYEDYDIMEIEVLE